MSTSPGCWRHPSLLPALKCMPTAKASAVRWTYWWQRRFVCGQPPIFRLPLQVPNPEFEGQTKTRLGNPEVRRIVEGVVGSGAGAAPRHAFEQSLHQTWRPDRTAGTLLAEQAAFETCLMLERFGRAEAGVHSTLETVAGVQLECAGDVASTCAEVSEALEMEPSTLNIVLGKAMQASGLPASCQQVSCIAMV